MRSPDEEMFPLMVQPVALSGVVAACKRSPRRPLPRRYEFAPPEARLGVLGRSFLAHIIHRVITVGQGPAVEHHPRLDVFALHCAYPDDAPVSVGALFLAADGHPADELGQGVRRALTTGPGYAVRDARLPALRRVDTPQPDLRLTDPDCIAVNDAGGACNFGLDGNRNKGS